VDKKWGSQKKRAKKLEKQGHSVDNFFNFLKIYLLFPLHF